MSSISKYFLPAVKAAVGSEIELQEAPRSQGDINLANGLRDEGNEFGPSVGTALVEDSHLGIDDVDSAVNKGLVFSVVIMACSLYQDMQAVGCVWINFWSGGDKAALWTLCEMCWGQLFNLVGFLMILCRSIMGTDSWDGCFDCGIILTCFNCFITINTCQTQSICPIIHKGPSHAMVSQKHKEMVSKKRAA